MNLFLVDTHALLWWLADDPALSAVAREVIADPESVPLVSAASLWEASIKSALGKLDVPDDLPEVVEAEGFRFLAVEPHHAWLAGGLPRHHQDPFDRMLIAQSMEEGIPVITGDSRFDVYGVTTVW